MSISPTLAAIARLPNIKELRRMQTERHLSPEQLARREARLAAKHAKREASGVSKAAFRAAKAEQRRLHREERIAALAKKEPPPA